MALVYLFFFVVPFVIAYFLIYFAVKNAVVDANRELEANKATTYRAL
jgi:hypothetical protein